MEKRGNTEISLLKGGSEKKFLIVEGLGKTFHKNGSSKSKMK